MSETVDTIAEDLKLPTQSPVSNSQSPEAAPPRGKRPDHDSLPPEIQACYVENLSVLHRMRETHMQLRSLSLDNHPCPDSERYPFLKELIDLDKKYRANWKKYDTYVADETNSEH